MKLVLAHNQSSKFKTFHAALQKNEHIYEYTGYNDLLFILKKDTVDFITLSNGFHARQYEAAYLTGYLHTIELAAAAAIVLDTLEVRYVDRQLETALSTSKLTEYARLASHGVHTPDTYAGTAAALLKGITQELVTLPFPLILKRADADRGIDNFKVATKERLNELLADADAGSVWILQDFIPNNGFYRLTYYGDTLSTVVFRATHEREDGNTEKAHLNKPKGGVNASMLPISEVSPRLIEQSRKACTVMKREFAGVDALLDSRDGTPYILEVNYNPQLVTVNAFKDERSQAFLQAMKEL